MDFPKKNHRLLSCALHASHTHFVLIESVLLFCSCLFRRHSNKWTSPSNIGVVTCSELCLPFLYYNFDCYSLFTFASVHFVLTLFVPRCFCLLYNEFIAIKPSLLRIPGKSFIFPYWYWQSMRSILVHWHWNRCQSDSCRRTRLSETCSRSFNLRSWTLVSRTLTSLNDLSRFQAI